LHEKLINLTQENIPGFTWIRKDVPSSRKAHCYFKWRISPVVHSVRFYIRQFKQ